MSETTDKNNSGAKSPPEFLLSKPVHLMTNEELALYRHQLSLLQKPVSQASGNLIQSNITSVAQSEASSSIQKENAQDEIESYSFFLFYFLGLPVAIGLIFTIPILAICYLIHQ